MSGLWRCLSVLCAAVLLPNASYSSEGSSLTCDRTVQVEAGGSATLCCAVRHESYLGGCEVLAVTWSKGGSEAPHDGGGRLDARTEPTGACVNVSNVTDGDELSVAAKTSCGYITSSPVRVQVNASLMSDYGKFHVLPEVEEAVQPPEWHTTVPTVLGAGCLIAVVGTLGFLFGTDRGRKVVCARRERIQPQPESETLCRHSV